MINIKMIFLTDNLRTWTHSFKATDQCKYDLHRRLSGFAVAFSGIMANNVKIITIQTKDCSIPLELKGTGGVYVHPRDYICFGNTNLRIRGIPKELYTYSHSLSWTSAGHKALMALNTAIKKYGIVIGKSELWPVEKLEPFRYDVYNWKKDKKITKSKLKKIVGVEKADLLWTQAKKTTTNF